MCHDSAGLKTETEGLQTEKEVGWFHIFSCCKEIKGGNMVFIDYRIYVVSQLYLFKLYSSTCSLLNNVLQHSPMFEIQRIVQAVHACSCRWSLFL